jgi:hypothetical protein
MIHELLQDMAPRYRPQDYSLLWHNCNHFSNELAMLLTGEGSCSHCDQSPLLLCYYMHPIRRTPCMPLQNTMVGVLNRMFGCMAEPAITAHAPTVDHLRPTASSPASDPSDTYPRRSALAVATFSTLAGDPVRCTLVPDDLHVV